MITKIPQLTLARLLASGHITPENLPTRFTHTTTMPINEESEDFLDQGTALFVIAEISNEKFSFALDAHGQEYPHLPTSILRPQLILREELVGAT